MNKSIRSLTLTAIFFVAIAITACFADKHVTNIDVEDVAWQTAQSQYS